MSAGKEVDRQEYLIAKIESEQQFDHTVTHAAYNYSVVESFWEEKLPFASHGAQFEQKV